MDNNLVNWETLLSKIVTELNINQLERKIS